MVTNEDNIKPAPAAGEADAKPDMLTRLRSQLKTVEIDGEKFYIAEGDRPLDEDQLQIYAMEREVTEKEHELKKQKAALGSSNLSEARRPQLTGIAANGKLVRWKPGMVLTYCILKSTFSEEHYQLVRENIAVAIADWEGVCGVKFKYLSQLDTSPTTQPAGVLFTVREIDASGQFIAMAFFPNDPANRRRVLIDPSYYDEGLPFDRVGVLRHELGHVLGFRHEHIRSGAPPSCPQEDTTDTFDFTAYDPKSVMHYFCGGVGDPALSITEVDREGAQKLYGPPLKNFTFVE